MSMTYKQAIDMMQALLDRDEHRNALLHNLHLDLSDYAISDRTVEDAHKLAIAVQKYVDAAL